MKHRNDQNKFILAQYKRYEVQRLYRKLNEISQRKKLGFTSLSKSQLKETEGVLRIPKNQDQLRKYEIHLENRRLVDRLSAVKSTVMPHIVTPRKIHTMQFRQTLRNKAIDEENQRLAKVLSQISLVGKKKSTKFSTHPDSSK